MTQLTQALIGTGLWMLGAGVGAWFALKVYRKYAAILSRLKRDKINGYHQLIARKSVRQNIWRLIIIGTALLIGFIVILLPPSIGRGVAVLVGLLVIIWCVSGSAWDDDYYLDLILHYPEFPKDGPK